ncbi:hypothetical protein CC2G_014666 [Coprinopsis cinerea AmutBmut pab1-1]|nr:hypothetical protein CC2G_014666 [Coprinopsis cinerea AmutBmut pab1-1]
MQAQERRFVEQPPSSKPKQPCQPEHACDDEPGPSRDFRRAKKPVYDEKAVPVDYPLKASAKALEDYSYAQNLHSLTTMFSRPKIGRVDHSAAADTLVEEPPRSAHPPSPISSKPLPRDTFNAPPPTRPQSSGSSSQSLRTIAERTRAFAQARGENIARTNDVAFQLGATILQSFELVQMLIDLQKKRKYIDEGMVELTATLEEEFRSHPKAEQLNSMLDAFLHHQTMGAIVNPQVPPLTEANHITTPQSTRLSVGQLRRLGFAYSTNPTSIAKHVQEMWSYA